MLDDRGNVDNDATVDLYAQMAVVLADAGANVVAPSGMMDGQVGAIPHIAGGRRSPRCRGAGLRRQVPLGLLRALPEAVDSTLVGDRRSYQQDPANRREAAREIALDIAEGADMVMVKPALAYLDVIADAARTVTVPLLAYQVSGEMAMVEAAAAAGMLDRDAVIEETLLSIRRAGADGILTYWAAEAAAELGGSREHPPR